MPLTTFLYGAELNQPTGHSDLDEYLAEARQKTGDDYQIVKRRDLGCFGPLGLRRRIVESFQLYVYVGGIGPWQVLQCAHDVPTIRAFLLGLLNGVAKTRRQWLPIATAPKDGRLILLACPGWPAYVGHWSGRDWVDTANGIRLPQLWTSFPHVPAPDSSR